jgi:hypothetical protein
VIAEFDALVQQIMARDDCDRQTALVRAVEEFPNAYDGYFQHCRR